jgi:hypothetical protein
MCVAGGGGILLDLVIFAACTCSSVCTVLRRSPVIRCYSFVDNFGELLPWSVVSSGSLLRSSLTIGRSPPIWSQVCSVFRQSATLVCTELRRSSPRSVSIFGVPRRSPSLPYTQSTDSRSAVYALYLLSSLLRSTSVCVVSPHAESDSPCAQRVQSHHACGSVCGHRFFLPSTQLSELSHR